MFCPMHLWDLPDWGERKVQMLPYLSKAASKKNQIDENVVVFLMLRQTTPKKFSSPKNCVWCVHLGFLYTFTSFLHCLLLLYCSSNVGAIFSTSFFLFLPLHLPPTLSVCVHLHVCLMLLCVHMCAAVHMYIWLYVFTYTPPNYFIFLLNGDQMWKKLFHSQYLLGMKEEKSGE